MTSTPAVTSTEDGSVGFSVAVLFEIECHSCDTGPMVARDPFMIQEMIDAHRTYYHAPL